MAEVLWQRHELSGDEREELTHAYDMFDTAGVGSITYNELKVCLRALGFDPSKAELAQLVREHDRELSGRISRDAFVEIATQFYLDRPPHEKLSQAFSLFDEHGTGVITRRDLKRVCREMGEALSEDELQAMIDEFDADGDGQLNADDFKGVLHATSLF